MSTKEHHVDFLLRNARIADLFRLRLYHGWVGIRDGRFMYVEEGRPPKTISTVLERDLDGCIILPGLIDAHMHIESSHLTPRRFSEIVVPFGTTAILSDPHEIANIGGEAGVRWMVEASKELPLHIYHAIPSCVPATSPDLEWTASVFQASTIRELSTGPSVIALGEMMDYRGLLDANERLRGIVQAARNSGLRLEGHIPTLRGTELSEYLSYGISSDHTLTYPAKIEEQVTKGVAVMLQMKSITPENLLTICSLQDRSQILLVTDDLEPFALQRGHLSQIVQMAIEAGMSPLDAFASASVRPARYLGLRDQGAIAPGYKADFVLLDELVEFPPREVYVNGLIVAKDGQMIIEKPPILPPLPSFQPIPGPFSEKDFRLAPQVKSMEEVTANAVVIQNETTSLTDLEHIQIQIEEGYAQLRKNDDLALAAVFARNGLSKTVGIIKNTGLKSGAFASSVAHDSHNLIVIGRDVLSMKAAANAVHNSLGGIVVTEGARALASLSLPIMGLLSDEPVSQVARDSLAIDNALKSLGMGHRRPFFLLCLMALSVSPNYKFTDKGVVDTENRKLLPAWEIYRKSAYTAPLEM
jgi:adenine deaminase